MKTYRILLGLSGALCLLAFSVRLVHSQENAAASTAQVHMVITDEAMSDNSEVPVLQPNAIKVKLGKDFAKVTQLIPAQGDNAALQLFILIDDTCDTSIGNNLTELREFINAQPATTVIGIAYMSNATIQITQNFTPDHDLAAKAVRLPRGTLSTMDSPYLSLMSLVKAWPQQKVRREVLMISDGIDRLRGDRSDRSGFNDMSSFSQNPSRSPRGAMAGPTTMPTISPDADSASMNSQRAGVIVHSIYAVGAGRLGRNAWEAQLGQSGVAKIADETGGEYFALGTQNAVSFKPYLDRLQKIFNNQYYLVFQAVPKKKEGLQRVNITTEVANADIAAADNVWVPAAK